MWIYISVAVMLLVLSFVSPIPGNIVKKAAFYFFALRYMILSKDSPKKAVRGNSFKPVAPNEGPYTATSEPVRIRVVFVRHGDSVWNSVVNRFGLGWPIRALRTLLTEAYFYLFSPNDSLIIDSPLSSRGIAQAKELADFIRRDQGKSVPVDPTKSLIVTSNLRRAMETALIGLGPRVSTTREKIVVDSALQEASRNVDALSFSTQPRTIAPTPINGTAKVVIHHSNFNPALNNGQKSMSSNINVRTDTFIEHVLAGVDGVAPKNNKASLKPEAEGAGPLKEVVVVGHSLWFKRFFDRFLPSTSTHISRKKKMQNCAVVAFDLLWDRNKTGEVSIDESSIKVLFKDFAK